jgi:hypothetical protein
MHEVQAVVIDCNLRVHTIAVLHRHVPRHGIATTVAKAVTVHLAWLTEGTIVQQQVTTDK